MRDGSNTAKSRSQVQGRAKIRLVGVAAGQTPKHGLHPVRIPAMAAWARLRRVRWHAEPNRHADHGSEQFNPLCKLAGCPPSVPWQALRIFQADASTSRPCYEYGLSRFFGNNLSLKCPCIAFARHGLKSFAGPSWAEDDALQRAASIPVTTDHSMTHAHVTPKPTVRLLYFARWYGDRNMRVPFAVATDHGLLWCRAA
jgi:hypothetical protein